MPYDVTNWKVKVEPLQTGLAGLKQLGDALRKISDDFPWDFGDCFSCGMGLARHLWPTQIRLPISGHVAAALGLPTCDLLPIFGLGGGGRGPYGLKDHADITPTDVADAIDRYIAGKEAA